MNAIATLPEVSNSLQQEGLETWFSCFIAFIDASPKTVETYKRAIRQFISWLYAQGITAPTRETVLAWRAALEVNHKPTTIQGYIVAVRRFFAWLEDSGLYKNVAANVKGAKIDKNFKKDYLTPDQLKAVLAGIKRDTAQGRRDYAITAIMATCGLRDIEVSRAKVGDLRTLGAQTVLYIQGKGRAEKTEFVIVPAQVENAIRASLADRKTLTDAEPLFVSLSNNSIGSAMSTRSISGTVKKALCAAGYNSSRLTAHSLRHTAITLALIGGATLQETQQYARHASINTTMIYAHNLDRAANTCAARVAESIF